MGSWSTESDPHATLRRVVDLEGPDPYWWATRSLRCSNVTDPDDVAVVVLQRDSILEVKTYLLLCQALRLRSWTVVVLLPSASITRSLRYARTLGSDRVHFPEEPRRSRSGALRRSGCDGGRPAAGSDDGRGAVLRRVQGSGVGRHVFASAAWETLAAAPDLSSPEVTSIVRRLMIEAAASVELAVHLLRTVNPRLDMLGEANYASPLIDRVLVDGVEALQVVPAASRSLMLTRLTCGFIRCRSLHRRSKPFWAIHSAPRRAGNSTASTADGTRVTKRSNRRISPTTVRSPAPS